MSGGRGSLLAPLLGANRAAATRALELLATPGRQVWAAVYGPPPLLFLDAGAVAMLQGWLLSEPRAQLQVLTDDDRELARQAPQFVALARRLSSRIAVRRQPPRAEPLPAEWLLTDRGGILTRRGPEAREWFGAAHAPFDMRRLQRTHAALWEPALPASELRELRL